VQRVAAARKLGTMSESVEWEEFSIYIYVYIYMEFYIYICDDDDCFYCHFWRNNVVIEFRSLSSFLT